MRPLPMFDGPIVFVVIELYRNWGRQGCLWCGLRTARSAHRGRFWRCSRKLRRNWGRPSRRLRGAPHGGLRCYEPRGTRPIRRRRSCCYKTKDILQNIPGITGINPLGRLKGTGWTGNKIKRVRAALN